MNFTNGNEESINCNFGENDYDFDEAESKIRICMHLNQKTFKEKGNCLYTYNQETNYIDRTELKVINKADIIEFVIFKSIFDKRADLTIEEIIIELYSEGYVIFDEKSMSSRINLTDYIKHKKLINYGDREIRRRLINTSIELENIFNTHITYNNIEMIKEGFENGYNLKNIPFISYSLFDHIMIVFKHYFDMKEYIEYR